MSSSSLSSKHADRTYIDPPAYLPRRGVPPPQLPSLDGVGQMDDEHLQEWRSYGHDLTQRLCKFTPHRRIEQHLAAEREAAHLPEMETEEELILRAAVPNQWVMLDHDRRSISPALLNTTCWIRCCEECFDKGTLDNAMRLYGRLICIGTKCYNRLKEQGIAPHISDPHVCEIGDAGLGKKTDDPFINKLISKNPIQ